MGMKKKEIVGAGLSGLVAAVNLARAGYEVTVYEKEEVPGGAPHVRPDPAGSPFDFGKIENYCGVDIEPSAKSIEESHFVVWGRKYRLDPKPGVPLYMVERGSRDGSIDQQLTRLALDEGVRIEYGRDFESPEAYDALPEGSIVATGFWNTGFVGLGLPFQKGYAYFANGPANRDETTVTIYMDDYTKDYAFSSTMNGIAFAMLFQKGKELTREGCRKFARQVEDHEGFGFDNWTLDTRAAIPHVYPWSPRLFHKGKIVAGTLAGVIEPVMNFGMLGALVSGKIAATASENPLKARLEFARLNAAFAPLWGIRRIADHTPRPLVKAACHAMARSYDYIPGPLLDASFMAVPGYKQFG